LLLLQCCLNFYVSHANFVALNTLLKSPLSTTGVYFGYWMLSYDGGSNKWAESYPQSSVVMFGNVDGGVKSPVLNLNSYPTTVSDVNGNMLNLYGVSIIIDPATSSYQVEQSGQCGNSKMKTWG